MTAIPADDPRRGGNRRHRGFTHKDKLISVVASEINGVSETAKALRISKATLENWRDDAKLQPYVMAARNQIIGDVTTVASTAWQELLLRLQNDADAFTIKDLVAVASESTNKMQLLSGGPTSRQETFAVTDHFDEAQTQEIVNAARRYLERNGPGARSALAEVRRLEVPPAKEPDATG